MSETIRKALKQLSLASMFLAIGLVLPFFTGQIPQVGSIILPTWGICPVKKGSTRPMARNMDDKDSCLSALRIFSDMGIPPGMGFIVIILSL